MSNTLNILLLGALVVIICAIGLNYYFFIRDRSYKRKHSSKKNRTKIEQMLTQKIDENVEMNTYKGVYDDCKYF